MAVLQLSTLATRRVVTTKARVAVEDATVRKHERYAKAPWILEFSPGWACRFGSDHTLPWPSVSTPLRRYRYLTQMPNFSRKRGASSARTRTSNSIACVLRKVAWYLSSFMFFSVDFLKKESPVFELVYGTVQRT